MIADPAIRLPDAPHPEGLCADCDPSEATDHGLAAAVGGGPGAGGRLAALVAHELNTPLQAICNLLFLAERDPDQLATYLCQARAEVGRLSLFLGRLVAFAQPDATPLSVFSCAELVERVAALVGPALSRRGVTLARDLSPDLPALLGAPGPLAELIFGLLADVVEDGRGTLLLCGVPHVGPCGPAALLTITCPPTDGSPPGPGVPWDELDDTIDVALRPGLLGRDGGRLAVRRGRRGLAIVLTLPAM